MTSLDKLTALFRCIAWAELAMIFGIFLERTIADAPRAKVLHMYTTPAVKVKPDDMEQPSSS